MIYRRTHTNRSSEKLRQKKYLSELVVQLDDQCVPKWIRGCEMLELLADLMVTEHLLNTLPLSVKSWVEERRCQELGRGKEVSRAG